tara:strand:- start:4986 stop:5165 length:180 start_codon:yes stop_codon:yes gene_type:complete
LSREFLEYFMIQMYKVGLDEVLKSISGFTLAVFLSDLFKNICRIFKLPDPRQKLTFMDR